MRISKITRIVIDHALNVNGLIFWRPIVYLSGITFMMIIALYTTCDFCRIVGRGGFEEYRDRPS